VSATPEIAHRLNLAPGTEYDYAPTTLRQTPDGPVAGRWRQGRYAVRALAQDGRTLQQCVVYEGLDGPDRGLWYTCSLADFALRFLPVEIPSQVEENPEPAQAAEPTPGKTAYHVTREGWAHGAKQSPDHNPDLYGDLNNG